MRYINFMVVEQIVNIPDDRKLNIKVPQEVPTGQVILAYTPVSRGSVKTPVFGCAKGQFKMAADFDEPLEDFKDYM